VSQDIELRRKALLKAARSMVRLRHSLAADEELATVLPQIEKQYNAAVANGHLPDVAELLYEFVEGPPRAIAS